MPLAHLDFGSQIQQKSTQSIPRSVLVEVLQEQYQNLSGLDVVNSQIQALGDSRTFTVTTGHQLVLHGGPLFTLYKIATTIRMAEELKEQFPEYRFIPLFWMATEDHDFAEANHFFPNYCEQITWDKNWEGAVGHAPIDQAFFATLPQGSDHWREFYTEGQPYAAGFRAFVHSLFGEKGLVILDADHPRLKAQFIKVLRSEVEAPKAYSAVSQTNAMLEDEGYKVQVFPREINLFYLTEGRRERLEAIGEKFQTVSGQYQWSRDEILQEMEEYPARFSPNVVLRPLYQEMILPNLAYTGGWGELSYWMQLKHMFDGFDVPFPALIPRFTAVLFTREQAQQIANFGLVPQDFGLDLARLYDRYMPQVWDEAEFRNQEASILRQYTDMENYLGQLDPTLAKSFAADQARARKRLDRMHTKIKKSIRNKHARKFNALRDLKAEIQPTGKVQERVLHFSAFPTPIISLLEVIYQHCQPFSQFNRQWIQLP